MFKLCFLSAHELTCGRASHLGGRGRATWDGDKMDDLSILTVETLHMPQ